MCGYFGNLHECPEVLTILMDLNIPLPYPKGQYYQRREVPGLITSTESGFDQSTALWWYALKLDAGEWQVNNQVTSFNARNLTSPLWRNAIQTRRAVVFASEIGESNGRHRYLMRSAQGIALGAVYRDWVSPSGETKRSMAIITRSPHSRFKQFHEKSTPCFLPLDSAFLQHWLDPSIAHSDLLDDVLSAPRLTTDLVVHPVKSFKGAELQGEPFHLKRDP